MEAYHVVMEPTGWHIRYDDRCFGPYDDRKAALGAAIDAARQAGEFNLATYVVIHEEDGAEDVVWPDDKPLPMGSTPRRDF